MFVNCLNEEYKKTLGRFLRSRRIEMKLTQEQLAEKTDLSREWISRIECGKSLPNCIDTLFIFKALNLEISDSLKDIINEISSVILPSAKKLKVETKVIFGNAVRKQRKYIGLTKKQLAEKASLSREWICRIECGKSSPNCFDTLRSFAALNLIDVNILTALITEASNTAA